MPDPIRRIMQAWLKTDRRLGLFLENSALLARKKMSLMSDDELATACEKYVEWLATYNSGPDHKWLR